MKEIRTGRILGVTGHRPKKLKVTNAYSDEVLKALMRVALKHLRELEPCQVITGMALAWDTASAIAALHLEIPVVAAIPFEGQELSWPEPSQVRYHKILNKIARNRGEINIVSEGGYSAAKMLRRDEYIVDCSDIILALWDGNCSGGTAHTVKYAKSKKRSIINAWSDWVNSNHCYHLNPSNLTAKSCQ
ncbi:MAG: SLOG family protein [Crinalium sp.]